MDNLVLENIQKKIFVIRNQKVMFDFDLAELYGVENKRLNEQVRRNIKRFPEDFMFQIRREEFIDLKSQFATSSWGGTRKLPFAFTQNGIAMLSSVLKSEKAIEVNIQIMRVFVKTSELLRNQATLYRRIEIIARQGNKNKDDIETIFTAIEQLQDVQGEDYTNRKIGFD
ncbi:MAG: ORF6N domain-containing protein [Leptospirales bacterium]